MGCCNDIVHGVAGLVGAIVGADRAPADVIESRRIICRACDQAEPCVHNVFKKCICKKCGCLLKAKTTIAKQYCPISKWDAYSNE